MRRGLGWDVRIIGDHVEIGLSRGFPVIGDIAEESGDEAEEGRRIGEDANDAGSAFEFLVDALGQVGGAKAGPVSAVLADKRCKARKAALITI
jgi:hypothetical protein